MELESQLTSLTLSKRLKELGVKAPSYFWWRNDYPNNPGKYPNKWYIIPGSEWPYTYKPKAVEFDAGLHLVQAYSVAELGEMLPCIVKKEILEWYKGKQRSRLVIFSLELVKDIYEHTGKIVYYCRYYYGDVYDDTCEYIEPKDYEDTNEANARAKMLIHLIEHGLIKV